VACRNETCKLNFKDCNHKLDTFTKNLVGWADRVAWLFPLVLRVKPCSSLSLWVLGISSQRTSVASYGYRCS
jgi:hypothetical protein